MPCRVCPPSHCHAAEGAEKTEGAEKDNTLLWGDLGDPILAQPDVSPSDQDAGGLPQEAARQVEPPEESVADFASRGRRAWS